MKKTPLKNWGRGLAGTMGALLLTPAAHAADTWSLKLTPQGLYSGYSGSPARDYLWSYGAALDMQYLERGGVSLGVEHTDLHAKAGGRSISQNSVFVSGHMHLTPDSLPGRLTLRMDLHGANNNDVTNETDQVRNLQKGGVTLGAHWRLGANTRLHAQRHRTRDIAPAATRPRHGGDR